MCTNWQCGQLRTDRGAALFVPPTKVSGEYVRGVLGSRPRANSGNGIWASSCTRPVSEQDRALAGYQDSRVGGGCRAPLARQMLRGRRTGALHPGPRNGKPAGPGGHAPTLLNPRQRGRAQDRVAAGRW